MNISFDIFRTDQNIMPAQGKVLVSEPFLGDQYFKRSVILLTEHGEKGTVGFLLNKPLNIDIKELLSDFPGEEASICMGGPVGTNTIHYIHMLGDTVPDSVKVTGNIYWGGDYEVLKNMILSGKIDLSQVRFFVGYSGWDPGQLDREISENSWVVGEFEESLIMESKEPEAWKIFLERLGGKFRLWTNFPENPALN